MPTVTFVGTGEAFDPDLPNTSSLYRGGRTLLVDCGYAVPHALWRISRDPELIDAVYISHVHADHSFGLPALLLWMREQGRSRPIEVISGPGTAAWLKKLLELAYPGSSERQEGCAIVPVELAPGEILERGPLRLSCAPSAHSVRNLALRIEEQGKITCFSGDGAPSAETCQLFSDADLVVHECYAAAPGSRSHANLSELVQLLAAARVKTTCLLHFGRSQKTLIEQAVNDAPSTPRLVCPAPGDHITV